MVRALRFAPVLAFAACVPPEAKQRPADGAPFDCLNRPLPTTAPMQVRITGQVLDPYAGRPVAGASVEGFLVGTATPIFTQTSDAGGAFAQDQGTGMVPRNAYLRVSANGYVPTYFYPPVPIAGPLDVKVQVLTAMALGTLAQAAQVQIDGSKASFLVTVTDCLGAPLGGATVDAVPAGTVRYFDASATPSASATATDSTTGSALVANVASGSTAIGAKVSGMTLRSHQIDAVAGALIQTEVQP
jgi:hypothetical protein